MTDGERNDTARMIAALRDASYVVERSDAAWAWKMYSSSLCAGWLSLCDRDDELVEILLDYLVEADE